MIKMLIFFVIILIQLSFSVSSQELTSKDIKELQERLLSLGYPAKGIDGVIGPETLKAIQLYAEKNAVSEKDAPWVLNELRNSQQTSIVVKKKNWVEINNKINTLEENIKLINIELNNTRNDNEKNIETKFNDSLTNFKYSLLLTALLALAGIIAATIAAAYKIYKGLEKNIQESLESHFKEKKEALDAELKKFDDEMSANKQEAMDLIKKFSSSELDVSRKTIEAEFRSANAKIRGSYGYTLWVQLKYFKTTHPDVYRELLPLFLNVVDSTVAIARKLPEEDQYIEDKLTHLINSAYFFAFQPEYKNYHGKAIDIVKEVQPYLEKAKKGNEFWSEMLESIVFINYRLKIKNAYQTKKALEELFSCMDDAWVEKRKVAYPELFK